MRALEPGELLSLWERFDGQSPTTLARALLEAGAGKRPEALSALSIGSRDAQLFALRAQTFGDAAEAQTRCPACGERLEFTLAMSELAASCRPPAGHDLDWQDLSADDGWQLRWRVPRVEDVEALQALPRTTDRRLALLARCVDGLRCAGRPAQVSQMPETLVAAVAQHMEAFDPGADIVLAFDCDACGHHWPASFDIVGYLWSELGALARRLLRDVDTLARAYGWREPDILALSSQRRRAYLELAQS
jgi:hypothetical protein